ncbi:hypothetical protein EB796_006149 [Bugula neritina]|uniref:BAR domain-containing protein n=1 Tax=Bugula neritina TaxID=10212 RepID=A0A7J7KCF8_BUGNE|nr:hypothetical protein EB796_006149 [Bugula neritina]
MEPKGAFAKAFQKTLNRTKAKVLQNLGKADRTTDEQFEEHVANFNKQQTMACKLHKEMKHYVTCRRVNLNGLNCTLLTLPSGLVIP